MNFEKLLNSLSIRYIAIILHARRMGKRPRRAHRIILANVLAIYRKKRGLKPMKALLIEDDRLIGDIIADALTTHHWVVERAWDGEAGLELTTAQEYDLILLDIGLPKIDGITVCQQLRSKGCQTPILLLTGQNSAEAQIIGLDAGADDYVTKPFDVDILLARVRAIVRKGKSATSVLTWETINLIQPAEKSDAMTILSI